MERGYQLLKDSHGKLPSKSSSAMANWLAGWDVLKSAREKEWWLGDGLHLVDKAKAMGYQAPSNTTAPANKYDVIVWLRRRDCTELDTITVAELTPNKRPVKRRAEVLAEAQLVSKRPAEDSTRPHGWHTQK